MLSGSGFIARFFVFQANLHSASLCSPSVPAHTHSLNFCFSLVDVSRRSLASSFGLGFFSADEEVGFVLENDDWWVLAGAFPTECPTEQCWRKYATLTFHRETQQIESKVHRCVIMEINFIHRVLWLLTSCLKKVLRACVKNRTAVHLVLTVKIEQPHIFLV